MQTAMAASALETLNSPGIVMENSPLYLGEATVKYSPSPRFSTPRQDTVSLSCEPKVMSSQRSFAYSTTRSAYLASVLTQPKRQESKILSLEEK